ncbi:hypothetical protein CVT24_012639 [Panaeolus cyanescens]|uniref:Uncharacterized protein n=1 Tax=Panaeolus cyanescens TaxID=181874 RepID=A0A409WUK7_9AGAR|nr:hypothetical protein CVT24_012639 [Panaeolus cyanescens]
MSSPNGPQPPSQPPLTGPPPNTSSTNPNNNNNNTSIRDGASSSSHTTTASHTTTSSQSQSQPPSQAQYIDYTPRDPGLRSPHPRSAHEDARLLHHQSGSPTSSSSQPTSPFVTPAEFGMLNANANGGVRPRSMNGAGGSASGSGSGSMMSQTPQSGFISSPLNPAPGAGNMSSAPSSFNGSVSAPGSGSGVVNPFGRGSISRPASRGSTMHSPTSPGVGAYDDALFQTLGLGSGAHTSGLPASLHTSPHSNTNSQFLGVGGGGSNRGSMILYRLADGVGEFGGSVNSSKENRDSLLLPPKLFGGKGGGARDSIHSMSGDSMISLSSDRDSKYPLGITPGGAGGARGLVPYAYDPDDDADIVDDDDLLHDPDNEGPVKGVKDHFPWRGVANVTALVVLLMALMTLFIAYPVITFYRDQPRNERIDGNVRINGTGQAPVLFGMPELIDSETPQAARSRRGFDGMEYELVFSDEFNTDGRTFYPGEYGEERGVMSFLHFFSLFFWRCSFWSFSRFFMVF